MQVALDDALADLRSILLDPDRLIRAVGSGRRRGLDAPRWRRVELRPVDLRAGRRLQVVRYDERQAFAENLEYGSDVAATVKELLAEPFGNWHVDTAETTIQLRITKKGRARLHRAAAGQPPQSGPAARTAHDRVKQRVLPSTDPMLHAVGITTADGSVKPSRRDKYRQVEEFLRTLEQVLPDRGASLGDDATPLPAAGVGGVDGSDRPPLRVVDLGCGNAYLTFAAYSFLTRRGLPVQLVGVDLKAQARARNTAIAAQLGWSDHVRFLEGSISDAQVEFDGGAGNPDLVLALHACDTATDDALARGIRWQAPVILAAPCCHHDVQAQLRRSAPPRPYTLVTRHGILRERFADVLTDALRAAILRRVGYRVDVIEFVATEHTPRNVLIRAIRTGAAPTRQLVEEYDALVQDWSLRPRLAALIPDLLPGRTPDGRQAR